VTTKFPPTASGEERYDSSPSPSSVALLTLCAELRLFGPPYILCRPINSPTRPRSVRALGALRLDGLARPLFPLFTASCHENKRIKPPSLKTLSKIIQSV